MNIISFLLDLVFEKPFPDDILETLHPAAAHQETFIFSIFDYKQQTVRDIIRYFKKHNDRILKQKIARSMSLHISDHLADQQVFGYFQNPILVPVPVSKQRLRERGFNQTHILAKYIAKDISGDYIKNAVQKQKQTKKQALVKNRNDRFANIRGAFHIPENKKHLVQNKDVIVVDDLTTTGATIMEMRRVLRDAGAREVIGLTIAH
ncbi:MAG: ComF family protein [Minisyncoccia bacterium]